MDTKECLISPRSNPTKGADDGYGLLARNIPQFHSVNQLPIKLDPARLDDGSGIQETLKTNHAQYHASCRILFNNTKLQRAQKRKRPTGDGDESNSSRNKVPRRGPTPQKAECFLCEEEGGEVREAMTMKLNKKVNKCTKRISDGKLLAKLSAGDVVAQELKYHPTCLVALYNRERAHLHELKELKKTEEMERNAVYPIAFSELVTYITETKGACESSNPLIFRLCDLCLLYRERLEQLGIESPAVHATRLKDQLLVHILELRAHREGRDVMLAFEEDVGAILADMEKPFIWQRLPG